MPSQHSFNPQTSCVDVVGRLSGGARSKPEHASLIDSRLSVSVITVVRNGESTIRMCIESVQAQTYQYVEHVIIDGGSTDATVSILRSYGDKISLWISEPDSGIYNALNKGIELASGSHYIPLGCDDILLPNGIACLAQQASTNMVICGLVRFVDKHKNVKGMIYNHSAGVLIDVNAHAALGLYDESYRIAADTKFLQLAANASCIHKIEDVVGEFVFGGASSNYRQNVREHARAMLESGSWSAIKAFLWRTPRLLWSIYR